MYTVINIEDDIVLLENRETREIFSVTINELDNNVKENDIVNYVDGIYKKDILNTEDIMKNIRDKFNKLRK